jgi:hypothetical protein
MSLQEQIAMCSEHYGKWKQLALTAVNMQEGGRCLKRAFFWLELQAAFVALWAVEQTRGDEPEAVEKIIEAKGNLTKKLADYANETLNEIGF